MKGKIATTAHQGAILKAILKLFAHTLYNNLGNIFPPQKDIMLIGQENLLHISMFKAKKKPLFTKAVKSAVQKDCIYKKNLHGRSFQKFMQNIVRSHVPPSLKELSMYHTEDRLTDYCYKNKIMGVEK